MSVSDRKAPSARREVDEAERLLALRRYDVLDSEPEEAFDDLVRLAARTCGTPMALLSLVDVDRQWFKARVGLEVPETPREFAFCRFALDRDSPLVVPDSHLDERFRDNPLVTGAPHLRSYAGAPLTTSDGHVLGTLCVLDRDAREFTVEELGTLEVLARQAVEQLERRREVRMLRGQLALADALVAAEERWRLTLDHSPTGIAVMSLDGRFLRVNDSLVDILGYPRETLLCKTFKDLTHPDDLEASAQLHQRMMASGVPISRLRKRYVNARGQVVWGELSLALVNGPDGAPLHAVAQIQDLTNQLAQERALREAMDGMTQQAAYLASVLDSVEIGLVACTPQGEISLLNPTGRHWHGVTDLLPTYAGELALSYTTPEGARLAPDDLPLLVALRTGRSSRELVLRSDSQPPRLVVADAREIRDLRGLPLGAVMTVTDVTEERQRRLVLESANRELAGLTSELRRSNEHLEQFASVASHDLRSPIIVVNGFLELLALDYAEVLDERALGYIDRAQQAGRRMASLINALLTHSRLGAAPSIEPVDLALVVDQVRDDLLHDIDRLKADLVVQGELPVVNGDPALVYQLMQNLVGNALKHHAGEHTPRIVVSARFRPDPVRPAWILSVADNGPGIPLQERLRVFDMFAAGESSAGHGIGLATCQEVLRKHGGRIWVEETEGGGATLSFDLPHTPSSRKG